jgi:hypothetical protein
MVDVTALYENFDLIHSDRLIEQLDRTTTNNNSSAEYGNLATLIYIHRDDDTNTGFVCSHSAAERNVVCLC